MSKISYIDNIEEWASEFTFSTPIRVRFCETDAFGHLNNTKALIYFEEARIEFFKSLGFMQKWASRDNESMIDTADIQCNYVKQVYFDEDLRAYAKISHIGNSSLDLHYMIKNSRNEICLTGRGLIVQVSKNTGKSTPWSEEMLEQMKKTYS